MVFNNIQLLVYSPNLELLYTLDMFQSLIWTERYNSIGEFELYTPINAEIFNQLKINRFLRIKESDYTMIIEDIKIENDVENGDNLVVTGRSIESILDRRIIWDQTNITGSIQNGIKQLIDSNIIAPRRSERKISNFIFEESTDEALTTPTFEGQYFGENLLDVIRDLCQMFGIGFKIDITDDQKFKFKLYSGVDRSYRQTKNPYVTFSPKYDNILNITYLQSIKELKTVALVKGEGDAPTRYLTVAVKDGYGEDGGYELERRESFVNAQDLSIQNEDGTSMGTDQYYSILKNRGRKQLAEESITDSFDGEASTVSTSYTYKTDYFLGDIVQFANEYGVERSCRVSEFIYSQDTSGIKYYPTFELAE